METVLRVTAVYFFLLVIFHIAGKRSMAQITTFDFIVLLIISESTQQAMIRDDFSVTNAFIVIVSLIGLDITLTWLKHRFPAADKIIDGLPLVLVDNGRPVRHLMNKARIDDGDIMTAARASQGLERMDQIKYAVLERSGGISIIPKQ
jgi:uncharacterized membrane protein YcaP (DUF421 family)